LQSSTFGVGLFYLAGLLPDPDESYTINLVSRNMWIISTLYEITWLAHG
jgi:ATP-binding cassette, subfamily B, vacuolar membrane transporter HMT1/ACLQ